MFFYANTGNGEKIIGEGVRVDVTVGMSKQKIQQAVSLTFGGKDNANKILGFTEVVSVSFSYDEYLSFVEKVNNMKQTCEHAKQTAEQACRGRDEH